MLLNLDHTTGPTASPSLRDAVPSPPLSSRVATRLVICVDGTWGEPDGTHKAPLGNISNIYRIHASTKEGKFKDSSGRIWNQRRKYFKGLNNINSYYGKLISGAFGKGLEEQIKEIFAYCCQQVSDPEDEIYFFGFSRGAFAVRAVANLLLHMRIPVEPPGSKDFDELYAEALSLYKNVRQGSNLKKGAIYDYMSKTRPPPRIRFVGVFDTVKAFNDDGLYDIQAIESLGHCRQALALNERKELFAYEPWKVSEDTINNYLGHDHSVKQAWFIGTHADLGGGNKLDGLSLYPLQWIMSEAIEQGLIFGFTPIFRTTTILRNQVALANPLELIFPGLQETASELPPATGSVQLANGVSVRMWDLRHVHEDQASSLKLETSGINRWIYSTADRTMFDQGQLLGHTDNENFSTFIHPSVYLVEDRELHMTDLLQGWLFYLDLSAYRDQNLGADQVFWDARPINMEEVDDNHLKVARILACGSAGIGKTTLISRVLKVDGEGSRYEHGVHDIEQGILSQDKRCMIHDSRGFQDGTQDEIEILEKFLKRRAEQTELMDRLHVIWYCVKSTRDRTIDNSADKKFFDSLAKFDHNIPVIIVCTKYDHLRHQVEGEEEERYMQANGISRSRDFSAQDWDVVDAAVNQEIREIKAALVAGLRQAAGDQDWIGPVFTSKNDAESINQLINETAASLSSMTIRNLFIGAQMADLQAKIDGTIEESLRLYKHAVRTAAVPIAFSGLAASTTVGAMIATNITKTFKFKSFSSNLAGQTIWNALVSNYESTGITMFGQGLAFCGGWALAIPGMQPLGAAAALTGTLIVKASSIPQYGRLLLMCTVDVLLIMERVFWLHEDNITASHIQDACEYYKKEKVDKVHTEVKEILPVWGVLSAYNYTKLEKGLKKIVRKHRFKKNGRVEDAEDLAETPAAAS
ncbi:hypothetical protein KCU91_g861, partial [Aureobasidium melanogenum]